MAQAKLGLIGQRYLEKCKVGLDSVGYLQTERYYTLLIGSTRAPLIYQRVQTLRAGKTRRGGA